MRLGDLLPWIAGAFAVALRLPFVQDAPYPDEGGLLVVAGRWQTDGPFLYGHLFVDRPPLLLSVFRVADLLGGLLPLRLLGLGLVLGAVLCAGRAGRLLGGSSGAAVAALTCAALLADPRLGTREVDAETVGIPLVLLAAVLALEAMRRPPGRRRCLLVAGAGAAGVAALLVKQNLGDGLVLTAALLATSSCRSPRQLTRDLLGLGVGAAVPTFAATIWAARDGAGAGNLWYAMYGFRLDAGSALFSGVSAAQVARLHALTVSAVLSGLVVVLVVVLATMGRRTDATAVALLAMLLTEVAGVAGGGYYWTHYLIGVVPATCLLAGRAAAVAGPRQWVSLGVVACLVSTVVAVVTAGIEDQPAASEAGVLGGWLRVSRHPGDSAVVLFGQASVIEAAQLKPAYPFLWTLPQRVLDPHLSGLVRTLDASRSPTWVVVRSTLDPWGEDPRGRVPRALQRHYRRVGDICGDTIYLHDHVFRRSPPPAASCP
jgi:hypothetical protein